MIDPKRFLDGLTARGFDYFAGVPDSLLKELCACLTQNAPHHVLTANEGNAVAAAAGYYMATGRCGVVYMQNSGIGNAVNPLLSLADEQVYAIP
ncbi:MAG: thiamine pyrophosphate-binding protein, partial [Candidatus Ornithomonoglobus sp.]